LQYSEIAFISMDLNGVPQSLDLIKKYTFAPIFGSFRSVEALLSS